LRAVSRAFGRFERSDERQAGRQADRRHRFDADLTSILSNECNFKGVTLSGTIAKTLRFYLKMQSSFKLRRIITP